MIKINLIIAAVFLMFLQSFAQDTNEIQKDSRIPLIGENAPSFSAETTRGKLNFPDDYFGNSLFWVILIFIIHFITVNK